MRNVEINENHGTGCYFCGLQKMALFFFDISNGETIVDDQGVNYPSLDIAKAEATLCLTELAKDEMPGHQQRTLTAEIKDQDKKKLAEVRLILKIK